MLPHTQTLSMSTHAAILIPSSEEPSVQIEVNAERFFCVTHTNKNALIVFKRWTFAYIQYNIFIVRLSFLFNPA